MREKDLEKAIGDTNVAQSPGYSRAYLAYLEVHNSRSKYPLRELRPKHIGTGAFSALMGAPITGITYELLTQMNDSAQYSQLLSTGYVALDFTLGLITALFGKVIWDYELICNRT